MITKSCLLKDITAKPIIASVLQHAVYSNACGW